MKGESDVAQQSTVVCTSLGVAVLAVMVLAACAPVAVEPGAAAPAEKVDLAFWNMPFVTQEVSPDYVLKWEEDVKTALPNVNVDSYYGPGKYLDQRDKFLLQAESGKPDVIEGLLEDMAAYVQAGLIEPLDERFAAWDESSMFVESTLEPLRIDGKLYGIYVCTEIADPRAAQGMGHRGTTPPRRGRAPGLRRAGGVGDAAAGGLG